MRTRVNILRERGDAGLADVRRALSLLDEPLTEAKRAAARQRLQRGVEALAIVWRELGEVQTDDPFTRPPEAPAPKGAVVAPSNVFQIKPRRAQP